MLGLSKTYVDAKRVVEALTRAQTDPSYYESAVDIINTYVEPERTEVVEKAIALGADVDIIRSLLVGGETIEIVGTAPSTIVIAGKRFPWWVVGLGGLGALAVIVVIARRRKTA